jgi:hypothetical protein
MTTLKRIPRKASTQVNLKIRVSEIRRGASINHSQPLISPETYISQYFQSIHQTKKAISPRIDAPSNLTEQLSQNSCIGKACELDRSLQIIRQQGFHGFQTDALHLNK